MDQSLIERQDESQIYNCEGKDIILAVYPLIYVCTMEVHNNMTKN